jgi:hypothetical protein
VIRQSLDGTGQLKRPKSGNERIVILPPAARQALGDDPAWMDVPWLFTTPTGKRFTKGTHLYYWRPVRTLVGRPTMDFYELRHLCATHLLELGVAHADVAVQLGHTDGGALVMSTYGHQTEKGARERLKRAYGLNVAPAPRSVGSQVGAARDEKSICAGIFAPLAPVVSTFAKDSNRPPHRRAVLLGPGRAYGLASACRAIRP